MDTRKRGGAETLVVGAAAWAVGWSETARGACRAAVCFAEPVPVLEEPSSPPLLVAGAPRKSGGYPVIRESHKATCTAELCQELAFYQG